MADLGKTLNVQDLPEDTYENLPANDYTVMIVSSEMKENNEKTGQYILIEYNIQDGQYAGKKLFDRLNVKNKSETAVKIAYSTLRKICEAVGLQTVSNTEQLHNKRFIATVALEKSKDYQDKTTGEMKEGRLQNVIKGYKPYASGSATTITASAATSSAAKPWAKK